MKGFIVSIAVILGILLISALMMLVIAWKFKYNLWFTTKFSYESASEDLALLSLLNSECNGEVVYNIVSNHNIIPITDSEKGCIRDKLKLTTASDCFRLYIDNGIKEDNIVSSGSCELRKAVCYPFSKPYNPNDLIDLICLQVG